MARDGSGNYTYPWGPVSFDDVISDVDFNAAAADLEEAITRSIATDGQSVVTANIPMGGYKLTGVGDATAATQYLTASQAISQGAIWCGVAGGTANAIELTAPITVGAYVDGMRLVFIANATNTSTVTVKVGALDAEQALHSGASLAGGEIFVGDIVSATYYDELWHLALESPRMQGAGLGRNYIINPSFDIAQWGVAASVTASTASYIMDGWIVLAGSADVTISRETVTPGSIPLLHEKSYFLRASAATATVGALIAPIEDVRTLAGKQVTLTFWARAASTGPTITPSITQDFGGGGSLDVIGTFTARALSTSWDRYRQTGTLLSISGKTIGTNSQLVVALAIGAASGINVDIAHVQLEEGPRYSVIPPRQLAEELVLCRRYWQQTYNQGVAPGTVTNNGRESKLASTVNAFSEIAFRLNPPMRVSPTMTVYSTATGASGHVRDVIAAADAAVDIASTGDDVYTMWSSAAEMTAGNITEYHVTADARL